MADMQLTAPREVSDRVGEAEHPRSQVVHFGADRPLKLDAGIELSPFQIAYQTYGVLNSERSTPCSSATHSPAISMQRTCTL